MASNSPGLPCASKLAFDNKKAAEAEKVMQKWRRGVALKPYSCTYCGLWHLASDYGDE